MDTRRGSIVGIILLVSSIITYIILGLELLKYNEPSDASWFHLYVARYAGYPVDNKVSIVSPVDLRYYNTLLDYVVKILGLTKYLLDLPIVSGLLTLFLIAAVTYYWRRDLLVAGLSSLLASTTPGFIYWFKYGMYGPWIALPILLLGLLLSFAAYRSKNMAIGVLAGVLIGLGWVFDGSAWVLVAGYSLALSIAIIAGLAVRKDFTPLALTILVYLVSIVLGNRYITSQDAVATGIALGAVISYIVVDKMGLRKHSLRIIAAFISSILSVLGLLLVGYSIGFPGIPDVYYKQYNPMFDTGALGLLLVLAALVIARSTRASSRSFFIEVALLSVSVLAVLTGYISVTSELYAIVSSSVISSVVLAQVVGAAGFPRRGYSRVFSLLLVSLVVVSLIAGNIVSSKSISSSIPSSMVLDIPLTYVNLTALNNTGFLTLLDILRSVPPNKTLIITYWGYTFYVLGYIGEGYYCLAGPNGPVEGWRLVSWIMVGDEATSAGLLRRIMWQYNISRAYIIVGEAVSIEKPLFGPPKLHIGRAIPVGATGQVTYQALGDVSRLPLYVMLANLSVLDFIDYTKATYFVNAPLAWTDRAVSSLEVKLVTYAAKSLGYPVVNDIYSPQEINIATPMFFKLVNTTMIPLDTTVSTSSVYNNYYLLALYEFNEVVY
ncbi:hypothetical protein ACSU1N_03680 [Thermogladius sp. 4427co]|uniref:hypothetical protein n=1 Tax=Thermogladius sp. 4427co TaxID=3450718 RepID=UPI003F7A044F